MGLTLDDQHHYELDGRRLISVTQALSILNNRWKVDPWYLERGKAIHLVTEFYDRGTLDESTVDHQIFPYLDAYVKFRQDTGFQPIWIEHSFHHRIYLYAGKIDRIGELNAHRVIVDLKSGAKSEVDELQGAAYFELCKINNIVIDKIFDLYLKDNGSYLLVETTKSKLLLSIFLAMLT